MFIEGDVVFWVQDDEHKEGVISRRTNLFYPHAMWVVISDGFLYYINEKDLELVKKAVA
jgi:hypothetical protein